MNPQPGELVITRLPNRSGLYLGVQETGSRTRTLARFTGDGEKSARALVDVLVAAGFRFEDNREER